MGSYCFYGHVRFLCESATHISLPKQLLRSSDMLFSVRSVLWLFLGLESSCLASPPPAALATATTPATLVKAFPESNKNVITNSPKLDLFLKVPAKCDRVYDNLISALQVGHISIGRPILTESRLMLSAAPTYRFGELK